MEVGYRMICLAAIRFIGGWHMCIRAESLGTCVPIVEFLANIFCWDYPLWVSKLLCAICNDSPNVVSFGFMGSSSLSQSWAQNGVSLTLVSDYFEDISALTSNSHGEWSQFQ